jgi:hypothetical protein
MTRVLSRIVQYVLIIGICLGVMTGGSLAAVIPVAEVSENEMGELSQYQSPLDSDPSTTTGNHSSGSVTVEYGNSSTTISPFIGNKSVTQLYGYNSISFASTISLQKSDTARVFLYDGPSGLSLVTVLDSTGDTTGASATYVTTGFPENGEWIVKDDPRDECGKTVNWGWIGDPVTDGGVFNGGLDGEFNMTITPKFNDQANRNIGGDGEITGWEFVHGEFQNKSGEFQNVTSIDMKTGESFETVTIRSGSQSNDSESGSTASVDVTRTVSAEKVAPSEEITVTTEFSGVSGSLSTSSNYDPSLTAATVQSVTVNGASTNPIISEATVNGSTVTLGDVGTDATVTITEELTVSEKLNVTHTITGDVTAGETTADFEPVSVAVRDIEPQSPVDEFDQDGNGDIEITELGQAGQAFAGGELSITELGEVGAAFAS